MNNLMLKLHPSKISIRCLDNGIDLNKGIISERSFNQSTQSYLGYLSHAQAFGLTQKIKNLALQFSGYFAIICYYGSSGIF